MRGAAFRSPLRFRRLRWALPIAAVALLSFGANAHAATVTVGSPLAQVFTPVEIGEMVTVANSALPEPGAHVTSPINGTIVRWRVLLAEGGSFKLRVLRPSGGTSFTGVGTSTPETPASLAPQTFATNLPIQAGDTIGLDNNTSSARVGQISPCRAPRSSPGTRLCPTARPSRPEKARNKRSPSMPTFSHPRPSPRSAPRRARPSAAPQ